MKKKLTILFAALLVVVTAAAVFAGCTENLKQDAISTEFSDVVASNGGMAVVYGNYLYFVNGYAGETAANTFGEVVKGAVCRVSLQNGVPSGEAQVIVPKNVYGTDKTYGGIYIVDDYIRHRYLDSSRIFRSYRGIQSGGRKTRLYPQQRRLFGGYK